MNPLKTIPCAISAALFFATAASADCLYTYQDGALVSENYGNQNELLGDPIAVTRYGIEPDLANEVGLAMNFECLYGRDETTGQINRVGRSNGQTRPSDPRNMELIPAVDSLTNQYPIELLLLEEGNASSFLIAARVSCDKIEVTFSPMRILNQDIPYADASRELKEEILSILGHIAQQPTNNIRGVYRINEAGGNVIFKTDNSQALHCVAAVS